MRIAIFYNRNAGYGAPTQEELTRMLIAAGFQPTYFDVEKAADDPAALATGEFVVAAGGDGTFRSIALQMVGSGRTLAPLPIGTANNFARSLGLGENLEEIITGWRARLHSRIDVGVAEGPWGRTHFFESVGLGLFPRASSILNTMDDVSSRDFSMGEDRLHRNRCVIAALAHEVKPVPAEVLIDGADVSSEFLVCGAMNIDRVGPGMRLAPSADPTDGMLDVVLVRRDERPELEATLKAFLAEPSQPAAWKIHRCRELRLVAGACDLMIDDEVVAISPRSLVKIGLAPGALDLLLPRKMGAPAWTGE